MNQIAISGMIRNVFQFGDLAVQEVLLELAEPMNIASLIQKRMSLYFQLNYVA